MRPAGEIGFLGADPSQEAVHPGEMDGLARVGSAGERQVLVVEPEVIDHAIVEQGQSLERLRGGPPEGDQVGIVIGGHQTARRIDHRHRDPMDRLDQRAARALDLKGWHERRET